VRCASKFSRYFGRSPDTLTLDDVHSFQVHLVSTGITWPGSNLIVFALRFFYGVTFGEATIPGRIAYAREPREVPVVLGVDEVARFLDAVSNLKSRAALTKAIRPGCGPRRLHSFVSRGHRQRPLSLCIMTSGPGAVT
jgi:integrase/recombinase XerD